MVITYYGKQFFKVQFGDTVVAYNPIGKESKLKGARFGADIAVVSLNHPDFSGAESVAYGEKKPFAVTGPGEYEINGVSVRGFQTQSQYAKESKLNTVYLVELEGIKLCFLGQLHTAELSEKTREALDGIDILFVPVGGNETLSPLEAHKLATKMEPNIIIPMDYDDKTLKEFLKESGKNPKPEEKLTIKKKDLEGKTGEVIVLVQQSNA
ncbi:MAG: MBL fold metallo-hydrolase [Patescibacteria group bacterium]